MTNYEIITNFVGKGKHFENEEIIDLFHRMLPDDSFCCCSGTPCFG